jgi:hypothetical protein
MKTLFFAILTGLTLASCSEISTDPAPTRATRTAQTVAISYALTASSLPNDTLLQGARIDVYTVTPTTNADGTISYPSITSASTPVFTSTTVTTTPQSFTLPVSNLVVTENTPSLGIRIVLRTTNRPGRRTTPNNPGNAQRLTASVVVNGVAKTPAIVHQGTNFSRTASASGGFFTTTTDTNVAAYTF